MLAMFITANRAEVIARARLKVARRAAPRPTENELTNGVPLFLDQLVGQLELAEPSDRELGITATLHGREMLLHGFSVRQVVQGYGDVCQVVTEMAIEKQAHIAVEDFRTLNRCLDTATAEAVGEFEHQRDLTIAGRETERLGVLAHELRNHLNNAVVAFDMFRRGNVAVNGSTGALLGRSLSRLRDTIERALAEVRLESGVTARQRMLLWDLISEVEVSATFEANGRGVGLTLTQDDGGAVIEVDLHILSSAVGNLLQNAFKFTPRGGGVSLRTRATRERVFIDIEDECGGLPVGGAEPLFQPYVQRSGNRSGVGLGLGISRRGVESEGGVLRAIDLPGKGCVFTIELPRSMDPLEAEGAVVRP